MKRHLPFGNALFVFVADPPSPGDLLTCPRCRLSFPLGTTENAPPDTGTVAVNESLLTYGT